MNKLRHPVAALVLFAVLVGLCVEIYDGLEQYYGIVPTDSLTSSYTNQSGNIMEQFKSMNLISGVENIQTGIMDLSVPAASAADILGGLASVGIGALRSVAGLVTTPFEVLGIITEYYTGISKTLVSLAMMVVVYVGFIMLSAYLRSDV